MTLIIEAGLGTDPNANSYRDVADLREYADLRGIDLTDQKNQELSNQELETLLIRAMDYLEGQRKRYKGHKTSATQPLQWPRADVWDVEFSNALMPDNEIPRLMEYAQLAIAVETLNGDNEKAVGPRVLKKKAGAIELSYSADTPKQNFVAAFSAPGALLAPLYKRNGLAMVRG